MRVRCVCACVCVGACVCVRVGCVDVCACGGVCVRAYVVGGVCVCALCNHGGENKDGVLIGLGNSELHEKTPKSVLLELQGTQGTIDGGEGGDLRSPRYN